jgi:hypothetical protein
MLGVSDTGRRTTIYIGWYLGEFDTALHLGIEPVSSGGKDEKKRQDMLVGQIMSQFSLILSLIMDAER